MPGARVSLLPLALLLGLGTACGKGAEHVELRLVPCTDVDLGLISEVRLVIDPKDAEGGRVGGPIDATFPVPDGVFDDGYATVFYEPAPSVRQADVQVTWRVESGAQGPMEWTELFPDEPVPELGGIMTLSEPACGSGGTTGGTTGGSSGTGTEGMTGSSGTSATGTTGGSSGTGTTGTTSTTATTGTTGESCMTDGMKVCAEHSPITGVGDLVVCEGGVWKPAVLEDNCFGCGTDAIVGCVGMDMWTCVCKPASPASCTEADNGCSGPGPGSQLRLCDEQDEQLYAVCPNECSYTNLDTFLCQ